jgi:DNA-binding NtrC family response regulator
MLNIPKYLHLESTMLENIDILLKHGWEYNVKELQQYCLLICQMLGLAPLERNLIIQGLNMVSAKNNDNIAPLKRPQLCLINNYDMQRNNISDINISLLNSDGSMKKFADLEHEIVSKACRHYRGSKSIAAKELGVGRTTLYRKLNLED